MSFLPHLPDFGLSSLCPSHEHPQPTELHLCHLQPLSCPDTKQPPLQWPCESSILRLLSPLLRAAPWEAEMRLCAPSSHMHLPLTVPVCLRTLLAQTWLHPVLMAIDAEGSSPMLLRLGEAQAPRHLPANTAQQPHKGPQAVPALPLAVSGSFWNGLVGSTRSVAWL